ncbi:hypothetical protein ADL22_32480 [Streptomyces sp. NRRL F-4489]|uniref:hypothetical protein n=1 Tax=Streptomyces sp. NRRL F-4489 TaxID=1609095 RepID=UPI0007490BB8|nr:hypothetical protein [Streptomyces sp. NRRL F-4489]KUL33669.1 hypothetical protein ADL22_32480 [Streptomyces sp. NRRL F-4489]
MDQHAHGDQHPRGDGPRGDGLPEARAARSHGSVEPEHGATAPLPAERSGAGPDTDTTGRRRFPPSVVLPVIAALCFGAYTIWMDHTNGAKGGQAALTGLIAAVVSGVLGVTLVRFQSTMLTETRALAYGALFGAAMGWLYSLAGSAPSVLASTLWGLGMFAVMFIVSLYVFRTHRVREPHGPHRRRRSTGPAGRHHLHTAH